MAEQWVELIFSVRRVFCPNYTSSGFEILGSSGRKLNRNCRPWCALHELLRVKSDPKLLLQTNVWLFHIFISVLLESIQTHRVRKTLSLRVIYAIIWHLWEQDLVDIQTHNRVVYELRILRVPNAHVAALDIVACPDFCISSDHALLLFATTTRALTLHLARGRRRHLASSVCELGLLLASLYFPSFAFQWRELLCHFHRAYLFLIESIDRFRWLRLQTFLILFLKSHISIIVLLKYLFWSFPCDAIKCFRLLYKLKCRLFNKLKVHWRIDHF